MWKFSPERKKEAQVKGALKECYVQMYSTTNCFKGTNVYVSIEALLIGGM